jgi:hypothetical protein
MPYLPNKHWDTPHKAALQAQVKLVDSEVLFDVSGKIITRRRFFTLQHIPPTTGYRIINSIDPRRLAHSETRSETRGKKV